MSKLVWDKTAERLYETGVSDVALFVMDNTGKYQNGVAWNGITGVTESPEGAEPTDLYADNIKYLTMRSAESLNATITAYMYPDEFMACDGSAEIETGVTIGQQSRKAFALAYKTKVGNDVVGDDFGYKLHLIYGCTASPSEKGYSTVNDSPEAIEFSWEVTTNQVEVGTIDGVTYKKTASVVIDSTKYSTEEAKAKLAKLEEYIYGGTSTEPQIPMPADVIKILKGEDVIAG